MAVDQAAETFDSCFLAIHNLPVALNVLADHFDLSYHFAHGRVKVVLVSVDYELVVAKSIVPPNTKLCYYIPVAFSVIYMSVNVAAWRSQGDSSFHSPNHDIA